MPPTPSFCTHPEGLFIFRLNRKALLPYLAGRRRHACCKMANDARWWRDFEKTLNGLRKLNIGCSKCRTGNCMMDFATPDAQRKLREWHAQWCALPSTAQDAHILWTFQGSVARKTCSEGAETIVSTDSDEEGATSAVVVQTESDSDDEVSASKRQRIDTETESSDVSFDSDERGKPSTTATVSLPRRSRRGCFSVDILGSKVWLVEEGGGLG